MKALGTSAAVVCLLVSAGAASHPMMGAITWNRHVSRIVYDRCVSCHCDGGTAFSLLEYAQAREKAESIKRSVLSRTMPPWGAVKGYGDLRDDEALSQAEIDLIVEWVDTGTARGNNARALPEKPAAPVAEPAFVPPANAVVVSGDTTLDRALKVAALFPREVAADASLKIVAELPDGRVRPVIWLYQYRHDYAHAFELEPLSLPAGTVIRGVPRESSVLLIPARR